MKIFKESTYFASILCLSILPCFVNAQSVMNVLKEDQETSSFAQALENTGLNQQLSGIGPYTVFAPTNEAFENFSNGIGATSGTMRSVLMNHIMTGLATERSIRAMNRVTSLGGITLNIQNNGDQIRINNARLIQSNVRAGNGVIHIIDGVLR